MVAVRGCVESFFAPNILFGWACCLDDLTSVDSSLTISVTHALKGVIGRSKTSRHRKDLVALSAENLFGFKIELDAEYTLEDFEQVTFVVSNDTATINGSIDFIADVKRLVTRKRLQHAITSILDDQLLALTETQKLHLGRVINEQSTSLPAFENRSELSAVEVPIGCVSPEGLAVTGRQGHFFLYSGSNRLFELYERKNRTTYLDWLKLFEARKALAKQHNTRLVQFVIPEKQTLTPEFYPANLTTPTETLAQVELHIEETPNATVLPLRELLSHSSQRETIFRRTDTHFSAVGAQCATDHILSHLGLSNTLEFVELSKRIFSGDLGKRFEGPDFMETMPLYTSTTEPELVASGEPENGAHIGVVRKWQNVNAPYPFKVIAFGNSFFETGENPSGLSWWFARLFKQFHFYWTPNCDWALIENEQPDIVICQTIERFLPKLPNS